jgi:hypothetical protein
MEGNSESTISGPDKGEVAFATIGVLGTSRRTCDIWQCVGTLVDDEFNPGFLRPEASRSPVPLWRVRVDVQSRLPAPAWGLKPLLYF